MTSSRWIENQLLITHFYRCWLYACNVFGSILEITTLDTVWKNNRSFWIIWHLTDILLFLCEPPGQWNQLELINGAFQKILPFAYCSPISEYEHLLSQQHQHLELASLAFLCRFSYVSSRFSHGSRCLMDEFSLRFFAGANSFFIYSNQPFSD